MGRLHKFWSLSRREKNCFGEAIILLLFSNVCVKAFAFRRIDRFLRYWNHDIQSDTDHAQESTLVQHSIARASNVLPWKSRCLSRSIAKFIMLRRRGIPARLIAGVKFSNRASLNAHAWVETGPAVNDRNSENSGFVTVIRIG
jgi:hypothetical protein